MKIILIGVVLLLKVVWSMKTLDGKLPTLNGNGLPLNIDIDVSDFNRRFADIVNQGIPEEIPEKLSAYLKSDRFKEVVSNETKEDIKAIAQQAIDDIFKPYVNSGEFKQDMKRISDYITKASEIRPAFFVSLMSLYTLTGIDDVVKFDDVRVNIGGGYDKSTGVFTAGRKGLYQISCTILGDNGHDVHYMLAKNDAEYMKGYSTRGMYTSSTINAVMAIHKAIVFISNTEVFTRRRTLTI
ncbi:C1QL [Mytilus coruscus]|uniref:C1QL n=1 Tax=Mytilus coruscus TaxID=42192 RepID=A0A6J8EUE5_MYTCO|nr:C1QL [Mytilus coruscus]